MPVAGRKVSVGPSRVAKQVGELAEEAGCEGEVTGPDKMTESSAGLQEFGELFCAVLAIVIACSWAT